jgi:hypothetical protein
MLDAPTPARPPEVCITASTTEAGASLLDRPIAAVACDPRVKVPVDQLAPMPRVPESLPVAPIREAVAKA